VVFEAQGSLPDDYPDTDVVVGIKVKALDVRDAANLLDLKLKSAIRTARGSNVKYISEGGISLAYVNGIAIFRKRKRAELRLDSSKRSSAAEAGRAWLEGHNWQRSKQFNYRSNVTAAKHLSFALEHVESAASLASAKWRLSIEILLPSLRHLKSELERMCRSENDLDIVDDEVFSDASIEEESSRMEAEETVRRQAEETARRQAEETARKEAEETARRQAEETARRQAEETARRQAEETARRQAEETARRKAKETARKEAEETARRQAEETARRQAEETARRQAEETARRQAEETARKEAEETARRQAEETARRQAEETARRQAEETARRQAEETARRQAEETARRKAEETARRQAEETAQRQAEETARRQAEETARREAETDIEIAPMKRRRGENSNKFREKSAIVLRSSNNTKLRRTECKLIEKK
ncbi:hypothetical protein BOX15_Mlig016244g1, partial [Macrostomum lignano]